MIETILVFPRLGMMAEPKGEIYPSISIIGNDRNPAVVVRSGVTTAKRSLISRQLS